MNNESPSPGHEALERDIEALSKEIMASFKSEDMKESIREMVGKKIYQSPLPPKPREKWREKAIEPPPLPGYAESLPPEIRLRVEKLLDFAWHKGITAAIREVRKSDPVVMDAFHDAISQKLCEEFKQRGLLK